jgi:hypothetical protein
VSESYDAFWLRYLRAHANPRTRGLHYAGTSLAFVCIVVAVGTQSWRALIAAPIFGYGFAWIAHVGIERNRPETFGHPVRSLFSDVRMLLLWTTGRLATHLHRAGLP